VLESNDRAILDEYYEERKALEASGTIAISLIGGKHRRVGQD
jgi:hypothetical protein